MSWSGLVQLSSLGCDPLGQAHLAQADSAGRPECGPIQSSWAEWLGLTLLTSDLRRQLLGLEPLCCRRLDVSGQPTEVVPAWGCAPVDKPTTDQQRVGNAEVDRTDDSEFKQEEQMYRV